MREDNNLVEFYNGTPPGKFIDYCYSSSIPRPGEFVHIRKMTWEVARVTWAIDHDSEHSIRRLRACVELIKE